jgi:hypothetical protein
MPLVNPTPTRRDLLATGLAGLAGSLLLFVGDMLLYGHLGSGEAFRVVSRQVIANASTSRLYVAGMLGPIALLGYLPGILHLYWRLAPGRFWLRATTAIGFAATLVVGGALPAVWGACALALRSAAAAPSYEPLRIEIGEYLRSIYRMAEIAGFPAALLLFLLVAFNKTTYPRWTALLNPGLLMLLSPLAVYVPAPLGAALAGGFFNLAFGVFFLVSLATLNPRQYR